MPGDGRRSVRRGGPRRARRAARPAAPAGAARPRRRRDDDRPRRSPSSPASAPTCSPPGWRLTDAAGRRPPARPQPARPGPRRARGAGRRATTGAFKIQVAGPVDAGRDRREAARRQGAHRPRRPARARPGARRGRARPRRRRAPPAARRGPAGRPGRRAGAGRRAGRRRCRPRPASAGTARVAPARGLGGARVGARRDHRGGRPSRGCTPARPATPLGLLRGAGARGPVRRPRPCCGAADHDVLAEALEAGEHVVARRACRRPTRPRRRPRSRLTEPVLRWLDMLGLDPTTVGGTLVVTPACGLAGASYDWARRGPAALARHGRRATWAERGVSRIPSAAPGTARGTGDHREEPHERPERQDRRDHRHGPLRGGRARRSRATRCARPAPTVKVYSTGTDPIQAVEGDTEPTQKVDVDGTFDDLDVAVDRRPGRAGRHHQRGHDPHRRDGPRARARRQRGRQAAGRRSATDRGCWSPPGWCEGRRLTSYPSLADDVRERRRRLGRRGGRRRRQPDHQPQPRRPARVHQGDRGRARLSGRRTPERRQGPVTATVTGPCRVAPVVRRVRWRQPTCTPPRGRRWPAPRA